MAVLIFLGGVIFSQKKGYFTKLKLGKFSNETQEKEPFLSAAYQPLLNLHKIPLKILNFMRTKDKPDKFSKRFNVSAFIRRDFVSGATDLYQDSKVFDNLQTIPKIIHQTNKENLVPIVYLVSIIAKKRLPGR